MMNNPELAAVADAALARLFERIGIDVSDRAEMKQLGRDLVFLRGLREGAEESADMRKKAEMERPAKLRAVVIEKVLTFAFGVLSAYVMIRLGGKP